MGRARGGGSNHFPKVLKVLPKERICECILKRIVDIPFAPTGERIVEVLQIFPPNVLKVMPQARNVDSHRQMPSAPDPCTHGRPHTEDHWKSKTN